MGSRRATKVGSLTKFHSKISHLLALIENADYYCLLVYLFSWLLHDPTVQVRCYYKPYIEAVDKYLEKLFAQVVDLQVIKQDLI